MDAFIHIRPETPSDQDFLAKLYHSTRDDLLQANLPENLLGNLITMQFHAQQTGYKKQFPAATYSIIEKSSEAIGYQITQRNAHDIRLVYIAFLPHERNKGHGRELIQALQVEATKHSKILTLAVSSHNTLAQKFYASLGFTVVNHDGVSWEMRWSPS